MYIFVKNIYFVIKTCMVFNQYHRIVYDLIQFIVETPSCFFVKYFMISPYGALCDFVWMPTKTVSRQRICSFIALPNSIVLDSSTKETSFCSHPWIITADFNNSALSTKNLIIWYSYVGCRINKQKSDYCTNGDISVTAGK